ncbi:putative membrane protein YeaQ/YmgE (transglycosylase-associated protein family) [Chitinophaga niastensis]|uniref:Putative membrane protein YeaQ/YmgE (Transglycosylase-associated protein family) n=1 Tax=Chitinophaga niastensis TaxID=536980 RepID=A0A2P8HCE1_CHINA|nr:GlsB/YeaQ/YmgE family stress response membrane protein [Chitinophaga niastensis]PSL43903.1 putative membrane protein YeaQ/YmgE (transglycosylase-associated protein family) [Chitinophaga niastensis]
MTLIWTLIIGGIAGWLAGKVMRGDGFGIIVDILVGIVGGWLGGWLFGILGLHFGNGKIGELIVAFLGAVILIWIVRLVKRG